MKSVINPVINQIEQMVRDIPGWSPIDQLYTLFNLVYLTSDLEGDVVEIGSWCGRSAVVLGHAARLIGKTKVICIDLFPEKNDWRRTEEGSYYIEMKIGNDIYTGQKDHPIWREPFERDIAPIYDKDASIYEVFSETVLKNDLQDAVQAFRGDSSMFVSSVGEEFKCKLVFIDGDHSYTGVCRDIKNIESHLVEGGWICFDDAFSCYDGVNHAIEDLVINNPTYELCHQMTRKCFVARKKRSSAS